MSSAMIKRQNGLQIIDEQFETLYEQYDENKMADVEDDEELGNAAGFIEQDSERVKELLDEHFSSRRKFLPEVTLFILLCVYY